MSGDVRDLIPDTERYHVGFAGMWYGYVSRAPADDITGELWVIVPDIDVNTEWGPCYWAPRIIKHTFTVSQPPEPTLTIDATQEVLPTAGASCLVIFDNRQNVWVAQWA